LVRISVSHGKAIEPPNGTGRCATVKRRVVAGR
jgi:hypothetical protein